MSIEVKSPLSSNSDYSIVQKVNKPRTIKLVRDLGLGFLRISTCIEERGILGATGKASVGETFRVESKVSAYEHENFEINCRVTEVN